MNVNVYVSDQWNAETKAWEKDTVRIGEICQLSKFLFSIYTIGIHVAPTECSQKVYSTGVPFEDGHTEHFVNNKLYIEICNE